MALTPWHGRYLCEFSYMNLPPALAASVTAGKGPSLGEATRELLGENARGTLPCGPLADARRAALSRIVETPTLAELRILRSINQNDSNGFVAYAFGAADGHAYCVFRGSDSEVCGVALSIDWVDNFLAPFRGSIQYPDAAAFVRNFAEREVTCFGHSKGGHNALYALSALPDEKADAVAFNAQGFARCQLTHAQIRRVRARGVNYVTQKDLVGALLWHPERRVYVKSVPGVQPHALEAFVFDARGMPVPARRPLWSMLVEFATRWYLNACQSGENCLVGSKENQRSTLAADTVL